MKFTQLWKGSQDGFGAATFHSKCNNKGPTLTVIKSNNDKIFGGYTSEPWRSRDSWGADSNAFIFSLTHKMKSKTGDSSSSIYDDSRYGPRFGGGYDIIIHDNCNTANNSCTPSTYALPPGANNTFLAGSQNFTVKEIEVYAVIKI